MPLSPFVVHTPSLSATNALLVTLVVWGMCLGVFGAAVWSVLHRLFVGAPIRALLLLEAFDEHSAKTLGEMGQKCGEQAERKMAENPALCRLVKRAERKGEARYYIPEELRYRAELRYGARGNPVLSVLLAGLLCLLLGLLLIFLIPLALSMTNTLL